MEIFCRETNGESFRCHLKRSCGRRKAYIKHKDYAQRFTILAIEQGEEEEEEDDDDDEEEEEAAAAAEVEEQEAAEEEEGDEEQEVEVKEEEAPREKAKT